MCFSSKSTTPFYATTALRTSKVQVPPDINNTSTTVASDNREQKQQLMPSNTTSIHQRTFHDQVENAALEANHHVERSDIFAVKGLPSLRGALGGGISFEKAQHAVAAEQLFVLSSEEVTDLDVRSAERERLRALRILSRKLHLSDNR